MEGLEKFREVPNKKVKANYKLICECHVLKKQESSCFERFLLLISHLSSDVRYLGVDKLAFN